MSQALIIRPICAFTDNYLWLLSRGHLAVVVDPGDGAAVLAGLSGHAIAAPAEQECGDVQAAQARRDAQHPSASTLPRQHLVAILVTHHHPDHVGGIGTLLGTPAALASADTPVFGPADEAIPHRNRALRDGDTFEILGLRVDVIAVPGHTRGHIAYHLPEADALFCGDTLFAGGCGRLFEGTAAQMLSSLRRIAALPGRTRVYCAHEYTLSNLRFARAVEPDNDALRVRQQHCMAQRSRGEATVPSRLDEELATNPFLRSDRPAVRAAAIAHGAADDADDVTVFAAIRRWKDVFKADVAHE